ncbi:hypothetical protein C7405_110141 [Paraburkholderia caballeronis]|uniref:zinc-binding metallopeptidase family protein n=1 Tax=Paraburkholderia caballeronis TaxID=416943 RepID=UPI0010669777|nr:putative zinc-binding metallopeptidase [Paraburkholderia caballeronis]TDV33890.1 hypothetical protein C7405_110141 [Paraburkholderia caballeronis]
MKTFRCTKCSQLVFFENVTCQRCGSLLGYLPESGEMSAFEPAGDGVWRSLGAAAADGAWRQCHNYAVENVCNWMIPADSGSPLCAACVLTRIIPDLTEPANRSLWYKLETAKRRLLYTLLMLGLPVEPEGQQPGRGMSFVFKQSTDAEPVMTGHAQGVITVNLAEADDATRERVRADLGEPYRTLLGHFRHEIGHYYFDRLVNGTAWNEPFRRLFGDERADYQAALDAHYENGPPDGWETRYISEYATMHPWEDWAETWAHYLHIVDTLDTATACGLVLAPADTSLPQLSDQTSVDEASFANLIGRWFPLTYALNSLNRSMGMPDAYPFALASGIVDKLHFVHDVVAASRVAPDQRELVAHPAGGDAPDGHAGHAGEQAPSAT